MSAASASVSAPASLPASAGIDVGKKSLDLNTWPTPAYRQMDNNPQGLAALTAHLRRFSVGRVVLEASGGYERLAVNALLDAGLVVAVVNPRPVRDFAKSPGILAKSDRIDPGVSARFGHERQPMPYVRPTPAQQARAALVDRRRQLVEEQTAEQNRLELFTEPVTTRSIQQMLKFIGRQI